MGFNPASLLDPGALAHQLVDSFLPKDMQWVGGVVGAVVDVECGNDVGAAMQGLSALSDLKDVAQRSNGSTSTANKTTSPSTQGAPKQPWAYEPSPPQPRVMTTTTTTTTTTVTSGPGAAARTPTTPSNAPVASGGWRPMQSSPAPSAAPKAPPAPQLSGWRAPVKPFVPFEPATSRFVGHPPTARPAAAPTATSAGSAAPESAPPAKASADSSSASAAKSSSADPSKLSKDNFMNLSDDDLMKAVRDGKIPKDVTDSQAGMMALQARMDHISEMNKMMTSMMQALHQMKMSVIENLRV